MRLPDLFLLPFALVLACNGDTGIEDDTEPFGGDDTDIDDTDDETCDQDTDCREHEICEPDECIDGDRNNALEDADALLWSSSVEATINTPGDVDFYTITAEGGEFVRISADTEFDDVLTELIVREPSGKVLTSSFAFPTNTSIGTSTVAFAYFAEAGEYSVSVEHRDATAGGRGLDYAISLQQWGPVVNEATDTPEEPGYTLNVDQSRIWSTVGALIETDDDVDYIRLNLSLNAHDLYIDGNEDITGSDLTPLVRLYDANGVLLAEKQDVGPGEYMLYPNAPTGEYLIEISDALGTSGAAHWFAQHIIARPIAETDPYQAELEQNGSFGQATPLTLETYVNGAELDYSRGQAIATLDAPDDVDYFLVEALYDPTYFVGCVNASRLGSQVTPTFEIVDADGDVIAAGAGSATADPNRIIFSTEASQGFYAVRLAAEDGADIVGGPDHYYAFHLFGASFDVSDDGFSCPFEGNR
ncbi:MAG: hypothetical protein AAFV53_34620 [Myxococcota bacterium]